MYICLCLYVCMSVCLSFAAFPYYCTDPDVTSGNGAGLWVPSSCALLGGFAIGAWPAFLWQHSVEHKMSVNDCTRSTPVYVVHCPSLLTSSLLILSTRVQWSRNVSLDSLSVGSSYRGDNCTLKILHSVNDFNVRHQPRNNNPADTTLHLCHCRLRPQGLSFYSITEAQNINWCYRPRQCFLNDFSQIQTSIL